MNDNREAIGVAEMFQITTDDTVVTVERIGIAVAGTVPKTKIGRAAFVFDIRAGGRDQDSPPIDLGAHELPETHLWQVWANHLRRHMGVEAVGVTDFDEGYATLTFVAEALLAWKPEPGKFASLILEFGPHGPVQAIDGSIPGATWQEAQTNLQAGLKKPEEGAKGRFGTCNSTPQDLGYMMDELAVITNYVQPNRQGARALVKSMEAFMSTPRVCDGLHRLKLT